MRIGSLCSGYGGLDKAAEALTGGTVAWVSDVDKGANKILAHRYPDVPNLGDFTVMDWSTVEPIDVLTAGYPCQPFSHAGKRAGTNDARHLWPEVLRCLTELRPPFALFENVRGHLSLGFDQVLADLATHDYDARWIVLRAADIGAPHGRARLFILAADSRRGGDRWDLVGAGRGSVRVGGVRGEDPERGDAEGRADLLGGMTLLPTPNTHNFKESGNCRDFGGDMTHALTCGCRDYATTATLLPTPAINDMGAAYAPETWDVWTEKMKAEHGNGNGHGKSLSIEAQRLLPTPTTTQRGTDANLDTREGARANLHNEVARMLPTPTSRDWKDHTIRREPHRPDDTDTLARALTDVPCALLPTPAVNDMGAAYTPETWDAWTERMKAEHGNGNGHGKSLNIEAQRLLQTPSAADGLGGHERRGGARGEELLLNGQAKEMHGAQWGDYAPAIHRWEQILGRPAPAPTMTSAKGNPQLSPRFVEWMQGLPEGWVDDVPGLTRNEKLKALGNGVVSAQAVEAVRRLLSLEVAQ